MVNNQILVLVNSSFELSATEQNMMLLLEQKINDLIVNNFNRLIYLLYRADINEAKLYHLLAQHKKENASKIIAALFVQRQIEKLEARAMYKINNVPDSDEERW